jgi:hypothetical protein
VFTFYTKAKENKRKHRNSGVRAGALDSEGNLNTCYGYIDQVWEFTYGLSPCIPIFKCQWVKNPQGELDEYGFTLVDLNNVGNKDNPWILLECVTQVFHGLEPQHEKNTLLSLESKESSKLTMSLMKKNTSYLTRCKSH